MENSSPLCRDSATLLDAAQEVVKRVGDQVCYRWLDANGSEETSISYSALWSKAGLVAFKLRSECGLRHGDRVVLCFAPGIESIATLWGCLRAGVVAVPVFPPDPTKLAKSLKKMEFVRAACSATVCLVDSSIARLRLVSRLTSSWPRMTYHNTQNWNATDQTDDAAYSGTHICAEDIAFLQFTSGSTADPKGVIIKHKNLSHNIFKVYIPLHVVGYCKLSVEPSTAELIMAQSIVTWVPQYHDLGLVIGQLASFVMGRTAIGMSPLTFIHDPLVWLRALSNYRAALTIAPNFAYGLVAKRLAALGSTEREQLSFDLSQLVYVMDCAERIRPDVVDKFAEAVRPFGGRPHHVPAYGLAEHVVAVVGEIDGIITAAPPRDHLVSVGRQSTSAVTILIVDPRTRQEVLDGEDGEIWVRSDSVSSGYWAQQELSKEAFGATLDGGGGERYLRTGDLGFIENDRLYVSGRMRDMVVVRGRNCCSEDVELAVTTAAPLVVRPSCVAAFSVDLESGEEGLVVVFEVNRQAEDMLPKAIDDITVSVSADTGLSPSRVVAITARTIHKTTSGKIQRRATKQALLDGQLSVVYDTAANSFQREVVPAFSWRSVLSWIVPRQYVSSTTRKSEATPLAPTPPLSARSTTCTASLPDVEYTTWLHNLGGLDPLQRQQEIANLIRQEAERVAGVDALSDTQPWGIAGFDSVKMLELQNALQRKLGPSLKLSTTALFDYPCVGELAGHIDAALYPTASPSSVQCKPAPAESMAIVGMACRFPCASSPTALWTLLEGKGDAMREIPLTRMDWRKHFGQSVADSTERSSTNRGAFIDGVTLFDNNRFGISAAEAAVMDPQQRIALEVAFEAMVQAKIVESDATSVKGVFVAQCSHDFATMTIASKTAMGPYSASGGAASIAANRVSHVFGLTGPSVVVDTACSSSLVAIDSACKAVYNDDCQTAVVVGVNLNLTMNNFVALSAAGMLSSSGRCATFSDQADGYARGEGCGALVLKPLSRALTDGNAIWGVLHGTAVNQDGKTATLTAPNGPTQQRLVRTALARAGVASEEIGYVEAHGTGTPLGDPQEVGALATVFGGKRERSLVVGAIKSNIGHLEAAAGIAGVIKAVLCLHHRRIPPNIHCETLNPSVELLLAECQFEFPRESVALEGEYAGVSSFGFGGTNAHVVLGVAPEGSITPVKPEIAWDRSRLPWTECSHPFVGPLKWQKSVSFQTSNWDNAPALTKSVASQVEAVGRWTDLEERLAPLYLRAIAHSLHQLGFDLNTGSTFSPEEIASSLKIVPAHQRLFRRMLQLLADAEATHTCDDDAGQNWCVQGIVEFGGVGEELQSLLSEFPEHAHEIELMRRCLPHLAAVLSGNMDPLQLIFPPQDPTAMTRLYAESSMFNVYFSVIRNGLDHMLRRACGSGQMLRVLEIGAGTGGLTQAVLPVFASERTEYHYTDMSASFFTYAKKQLVSFPFVEYGVLDVEKDPSLQGWEAESFDVILAFDVLHSTASLQHTMNNVHQLLAPGGLLAILEPTSKQPFADLTFGLLPGWWAFQDLDQRPDHCLIGSSEWQRLLHAQGFIDATDLSAMVLEADLGHSVIFCSKERSGEANQADRAVCSVTWDQDIVRYLANHRVGQLPVVPAACYLEMLAPVVEELCGDVPYSVSNVDFESMLQLDEAASPRVRIVLVRQAKQDGVDATSADKSAGSYWVAIESWDDERHKWTKHATMFLSIDGGELPERQTFVIQEIQARCGDPRACGEAFYAQLGNEAGGDFRCLHSVWSGNSEALSRIVFGSQPVPAFLRGCAALDNCLQATFVVDRISSVHAAGTLRRSLTEVWAHVQRVESGDAAVGVYDTDGRLIMRIMGISSKQHIATLEQRDIVCTVDRWQDCARPVIDLDGNVEVLRPRTLEDLRDSVLQRMETRQPLCIVTTDGNEEMAAFVRCLRQEFEDWSVTCLQTNEEVDGLPALAAASEQDWRFQRGQWQVRRCTPLELRPAVSSAALSSRGQIRNLTVTKAARLPVAPGQVEIRVSAVGLNFRDVLNVLGLYPGDAGPPGTDYAGTVTAVGDGVSGLPVGSRVFGAALGALEGYIHMDPRHCLVLPDSVSFQTAASLPSVITTVYYALLDCAQLRAGQTVLIHAGAGGVGLTAVWYAQQLGCEVIATVGSEAKCKHLLGLGVSHVTSSRDPVEFRASMESWGKVDVVLNCLAGQFIELSFAALRNGGHFCELGKTEIWSVAEVQSRRPDVYYHIIDMHVVAQQDPFDFHQLFRKAFDFGTPTLPVQTFPMDQVQPAFEHLKQAKHIGKVVLLQDSAVTDDGFYLISGGLGHLGIQCAAALVAQGARNLVLLSSTRTELPHDWNHDVRPMIELVDVGNLMQLQGVFRKYPNIKGVVHSAGVLVDSTITNLTPAVIQRVYRPKVEGARNLHLCSRELSLDFFLLFSSAAAAFGSAAQVAHAAANGCLDDLAVQRRREGLVACSIRWGPWLGGGQALPEAIQSLSLKGIKPIQSDLGVDFFTRLLRPQSEPVVMVCPMDPRRLPPIPYLSAIQSQVAHKPPASKQPPVEQSAAWSTLLQPLGESDRHAAIVKKIFDAAVLSGAFEECASNQEWSELGLDSLGILQLRNVLQKELGQAVRLSSTALLDFPSPEKLAYHIDACLFSTPADNECAEATASACTILRSNPQGVPTIASLQQEQMYALHFNDSRRCTYNEALFFAMRGSVRVDLLREAIKTVMDDNDVLRTSLHSSDVINGTPTVFQVTARCGELAVPFQQHSANCQDEAVALLRREALCPFDLEKAPLFRVSVCQTPAADPAVLFFGLTVHHAAVDGLSLTMMLNQIASTYNALLNGDVCCHSAPRGLEVQYSDYSMWQRSSLLTPSRMHELEQYWKTALPSTPALDLPTDFQRPPRFEGQEGMVAVRVEASFLTALKHRCAGHGCTVFHALLSAYALLLARLSNSSELIVGFPCANRDAASGLEATLGCFINTLPLLLQPKATMPVSDFVDQTKRGVIGALKHSALHFSKIVSAVDAQRDTRRPTLVQTLFNLHGKEWFCPESSLQLNGVDVQECPIPPGGRSAKFELSLLLHETAAGDLSGCLFYSESLFSRESVMATAERYQQVVASLAHQSWGCPVAEVSWMGPLDVEMVRKLSMDRPLQSNLRAETLLDVFQQSVERFPNAIAVVTADEQVSYIVLEKRANQLAQTLKCEFGVNPGAVVCLCVEQSTAIVVGMLAILKCGAAYVPIDPELPVLRTQETVADCGALTALCQEGRSAELFGQSPCNVACMNKQGQLLDVGAKVAVSRTDLSWTRIDGDLACYLTYTSGTTGKPKAVIVQHANIVQFLKASLPEAGLHPSDRGLMCPSFTFDFAVQVIWYSLATGCSFAIPQKHELVDDLPSTVSRYKCSVLFGTPTLFGVQSETELRDAGVTSMFVGGEPSSPAFLRRFSSCSGIRVVNEYGPTECSVLVTMLRVEPDTPYPHSLGQPLAGTRLYIVDRTTGQRMPVGVPGELCISGRQVCPGYLNRPELTERAFVPNPFLVDTESEEGLAIFGRMYRTGDLCRWLPDGSVEFLGRMDSQLKVRGFRIEKQEIESRLQEVAMVVDAAVVVQAETQSLAAFVVPAVVDTEACKQHLRQRLPSYMQPTTILALSTLPRTAHGKLDEAKLLKVLDTVDPADAANEVKKAGEVLGWNGRVLRLLREVLQAPHLTDEDDLFCCGLTSINAIVVVRRLRQLGFEQASLSALMQHRSVTSFCAAENAASVDSGRQYDVAPVDANSSSDRCQQASNQEFLLSAEEDLLVCYQAGDASNAPVICLYGSSGLPYGMELLEHMDLSQPLFATQAPELSGCAYHFESLPERAGDHASVFLDKFSAEGVHLVGFSYGALLATEIARILLSADMACTLTLIDPAPVAAIHKPLSLLDTRRLSLSAIAREALMPHMIDSALRGSAQDNRAFDRELSKAAKSAEEAKMMKTMTYLSGTLLREWKHHVVTPLNEMSAAMFLAEDGANNFNALCESGWNDDGARGWSTCMERLDIKQAVGDHWSFFKHRENVEALSEHLSRLTLFESDSGSPDAC